MLLNGWSKRFQQAESYHQDSGFPFDCNKIISTYKHFTVTYFVEICNVSSSHLVCVYVTKYTKSEGLFWWGLLHMFISYKVLSSVSELGIYLLSTFHKAEYTCLSHKVESIDNLKLWWQLNLIKLSWASSLMVNKPMFWEPSLFSSSRKLIKTFLF